MNRVAYKNRNLFFHGSELWKFSSRGESFCVLSSFWWLSATLGFLGLWPCHSSLCSVFISTCLPCVFISSLMRMCPWISDDMSNPGWSHHKILNLITSAKTKGLFSKEGNIIDSGDLDMNIFHLTRIIGKLHSYSNELQWEYGNYLWSS